MEHGGNDDPDDEYIDSDGSEYINDGSEPDGSDGSEDIDTAVNLTPARKVLPARKVKVKINYEAASTDDFFSGQPGYTDFGRTRKGGDRRPRAVGRKKSIQVEPRATTIMHFFAAPGASPMPKPKAVKKKKQKDARLPKTRVLRIDKPEAAARAKIRRVDSLRKKVVTVCSEGDLAVDRQNIKKWSGSVSCLFFYKPRHNLICG